MSAAAAAAGRPLHAVQSGCFGLNAVAGTRVLRGMLAQGRSCCAMRYTVLDGRL